MKFLNIFFVILFIFSAALQYNDPDPYVWMPLYLYGALLCFLALRGKFNRSMYVAGLLVYGAYALYKIFDVNGVIDWLSEHHGENIMETMKATQPWIEETREFFGLLLLIIALTANMIRFGRRRAPST